MREGRRGRRGRNEDRRTRDREGLIAGEAGKADRTARRAARAPAARWLGRGGLVAKAFLFGLIGVVAIAVAVGERGSARGREGALKLLAGESVGEALLIAAGIGFGAYALWRLAVAIAGPPGETGLSRQAERIGSLVLVFVYGGLCAFTFSLVDESRGTTGGSSTDSTTATLLDQAFGRTLVIGVAAVLAGLALYEGYKAVSRSFLDDLKRSEMGPAAKRAATWTGVAGHAARAVVSGLAAAFLLKAAIEYDADEAIGLDGALEKISAQAYGQVLLLVVAIGLFLYGTYLLFEARYRKM